MLDSEASHSFVTESMAKAHWWLVDSTELIPIRLAPGSEVVLYLMCTVPIVFCDFDRHAIT